VMTNPATKNHPAPHKKAAAKNGGVGKPYRPEGDKILDWSWLITLRCPTDFSIFLKRR